jgi:general secretion pathway protein H
VALGPEPVIEPQRILLSLNEHRVLLATDGLAPFAVQPSATAATADVR